MKISQLSIFLENKEGRLWNALDVLAKNNINIRALSLADTSDFGILRLIVQDPEKAKTILEENDFIVKIKNVIGVELEDTPGGLSSVLKILNDNKINLEGLYAFTHDNTQIAILLLQSNDLDSIIKILIKNNISILLPEDVYNLG